MARSLDSQHSGRRARSRWRLRRSPYLLRLSRPPRHHASSRAAAGHCRRRSTRRPLELYAGLPLTPADLEHELQAPAVPARRAGSSTPGTYRVSGDRAGASRCGRRASPTRAARRSMLQHAPRRPRRSRACTIAPARRCRSLRLEPLLIGSIFPIHGEDRIVVTSRGGAAAAAGGAQGRRGPQVRHASRRRSRQACCGRCG